MEKRGPDNQISGDPLVSVIIPVYNVEAYLPECLQSVTEQSMRQIEILLIDDGSTDRSYELCLAWAAKDKRIRCFHQENRGVSYARNKGLEEAKAEYIAFVDSDDWIDRQYLEKLYNALLAGGASYAECDLWRCDNRSGKRIYRSCSGRMGVPWTFEEHLKYGPTASYKAMSKRSLWVENHVRFPDCSFESPAVYALVLALSGKVENVPEALYYYRRFRPSSLIETGYAAKDGSANNTLGIEAMQRLMEGFESRGLGEQYRRILPGIVIYRLNDILAMQYHRKSEADFAETVNNFRAFLKEAFPEKPALRCLNWSGYNLNRILAHMEQLHDPSCRFNFSSLISLYGGASPIVLKEHPNRYRRLMLKREQEQAFWTVLKEQQPEFLILDLLEERFDILQYGDSYLTVSDAFEDLYPGDDEIFRQGRRIRRDSEECRVLWQKAAESFYSRLKDLCPNIRVVIVESYLCEKVGDCTRQTDYPEIGAIRRTNDILRAYYGFLREMIPGAGWISPAGDELYFTDRGYEYGAIPSHLNELENQIISEKLYDLITL